MTFKEEAIHGLRLYQSSAADEGPTKLFVGGLHGNEGLYTAPILERLAQEEITVGKTIIIPSLVENSTYIGVLTEDYYRSAAGMKLLHLINEYKPRFYFELHAYEQQSYSSLTDPDRVKKIGVPNFIDLDDGILIGSIAPLLRRKFTVHDFCMTIEVPKWQSEREELKEKVLKVLRIALRKTAREELMREFRAKYPAQVQMAEELFTKYYRHMLKPF